MMQIKINNNPVQIDNPNLLSVLEALQIPTQGLAIAINQAVIPGSQWPATSLSESDELTLIRATRGG